MITKIGKLRCEIVTQKEKKNILLLKKNAQELNNVSVNFIGDESIKMNSVIRLRVKNREASEKNQVFISRGYHAC